MKEIKDRLINLYTCRLSKEDQKELMNIIKLVEEKEQRINYLEKRNSEYGWIESPDRMGS